jgi:ribosomal protein S18 acetylase RimI-like enzyme
MGEFMIRPYESEDEPAVVRLWTDCGLVVPWNDPGKDIRRKLRVNPEWFLVGEIDAEVVATCMAGYEGHRGGINYLAVAPKFRRHGYATQIMREAERLLRQAGCPKINLLVRAANKAVTRFYEECGFAVEDVVCMGKRLEPDEPNH